MSIVLSLHPLVLVGYFGCWSKHEIGSLYSTLHPASQNSLKDMNDELARSGTIWAICAGKLGKVYEASVCWLNNAIVKFVVAFLYIGAFGRNYVQFFPSQRYHGPLGLDFPCSLFCYKLRFTLEYTTVFSSSSTSTTSVILSLLNWAQLHMGLA